MKRMVLIFGAAGVFLLTGMHRAGAAGTAAGTNIVNTATVTYDFENSTDLTKTDTASLIVDELINVTVDWADLADVEVETPDSNVPLEFTVTNTGNGTETFELARVSNGLGGDFDPTIIDAFFDTNNNGQYDHGVDTQYQVGVNDPELDMDEAITVFVTNNIQGGLTGGDIGKSRLTATSKTGTGQGTVVGGAGQDLGDGAGDAVVGTSGGEDSDTGNYVVMTINVVVVKSVETLNDPLGLTPPQNIPGAELKYTITVEVQGSGDAKNVIFTDPIPGGTTYELGTLTLDGGSLTDAADSGNPGGDDGDVGGTTPDTVTVDLGAVIAAGSPIKTITFNVTIND